MKTYVNYSMGVCSAYIACRLADEGQEPICVFSDTKREDSDTYRFGAEVAERWGLTVVDASDGRDLWEWFREHNMIPARQLPACSIALKVKPSQKFYESAEPGRIAYGFDIDEEERVERTRARWTLRQHQPFFPLLDWQVSKAQCMGYFVKHGIAIPRMYRHFPNANCLPCKNFQRADWVALRYYYPEVFAKARQFENESGLRWSQDGYRLDDIEAEALTPSRKGRRALPTPAFSFDAGCDRCAVN